MPNSAFWVQKTQNIEEPNAKKRGRRQGRSERNYLPGPASSTEEGEICDLVYRQEPLWWITMRHDFLLENT